MFLTLKSSELCIKNVRSWIEAIRNLHHYERLVILPSSEFLNRFLLEHRQSLEQAGFMIPLPNIDLYHRISDKHSFAQVCSDHGLAVPHEFATLPSQLPFVVKPLRYASSFNDQQLKPWLLTSPSLLEAFQQLEAAEDFFFQELAGGKGTYLLYFISRNNRDVVFSQENLIQLCNGESIIAAKRADALTKPIARRYLQMFKQLGYSGES